MRPSLRVLALTIVLAPSSAALARHAECLPGQVVGAETKGHCCWPAQVWSQSRSACVGVPQCGVGYQVSGESCVMTSGCPSGQAVTVDTAGRCCWLGQVWSTSRQACIGVPQSCPSGAVPSGDNCVAAAPAATAPAPAPAPPPQATYPSPQNPYQPYQSEPPAPPQNTPWQAPAPTAPWQGPAGAGGARVRFEAIDINNRYTVNAQGQTCTTPCTLNLSPGSLSLEATGSGHIHRNIVIGRGQSTVKLQHFMLKQLITGLVLVGAGLPVMGGGIDLGQGYGWTAKNGGSIAGILLTTVGATVSFIGLVGLMLIKPGRVDVSSGPSFSIGLSGSGIATRVTF